MGVAIHPMAVVEAGARLGDGVEIGPFCVIGAECDIGAGARLQSHVVVAGGTRIGANARVFPFAVIGAPSQDLKATRAGRLEIGADCVIREGATLNASSFADGATRIGDRCALLAYSHVAHDCQLGEEVVLSNAVLLGGHVEIGAHATIGGGTAVHQFVRVGAHAFVAGQSGLEGDVIPFGLAGGNRAHLFGLNLVGLRRRGFAPERIARIGAAYRRLFARGEDVFAERLETVAGEGGGDADVAAMIDFLRSRAQRPLCVPRADARDED